MIDFDTRWPTLLGPPTATGRLRERPEDFQVEEIPAYLPSGTGEHILFEIEKTLLTTEQAVAALSQALGVDRRDIGTAGLKDRQAVTRQWLSAPARAASALEQFSHAQIAILSRGRHANKLKTGHLRGNRFRLLARGVPAEAMPAIEARAERLRRDGAPNYFGPQRFGRQGENTGTGLKLLQGGPRPRDGRALRFLLSAAQATLFNDVLAARLRAGLWSTVLSGDVLQKADSGGLFVCTEPEIDQTRADRFEIHPTGPLFGPKMREPTLRPADLEREILQAAGLDDEAFLRFAKLTSGTRRSLRLALRTLTLDWREEGLALSFELPPGAYATVVTRELLQAGDPAPEIT